MTKRDVAFQVSIDSQIKLIGTSKQQVATAMGMSLATFYKKHNDPSTLTIAQARQLCRILKLSGDDVKDMI